MRTWTWRIPAMAAVAYIPALKEGQQRRPQESACSYCLPRPVHVLIASLLAIWRMGEVRQEADSFRRQFCANDFSYNRVSRLYAFVLTIFLHE